MTWIKAITFELVCQVDKTISTHVLQINVGQNYFGD